MSKPVRRVRHVEDASTDHADHRDVGAAGAAEPRELGKGGGQAGPRRRAGRTFGRGGEVGRELVGEEFHARGCAKKQEPCVKRAAASWATTVAIGVEEEARDAPQLVGGNAAKCLPRAVPESTAENGSASASSRSSLQNIRLLALLLLNCATTCAALKRLAIVTGGTRGIGRGISDARSARRALDLLLTYNQAPRRRRRRRRSQDGARLRFHSVGGDISLESTRDAIFGAFDAMSDVELGAVVHNAGQYVGITSDNADGLKGGPPLGFGDGSLLSDGKFDFAQMHYYQRMYGDAYVDRAARPRADDGGRLARRHLVAGVHDAVQCERRLRHAGVGQVRDGVRDAPLALRCAGKDVNCNVVVPGVTTTDAWGRLAATRGTTKDELVAAISGRLSPDLARRRRARSATASPSCAARRAASSPASRCPSTAASTSSRELAMSALFA